MSISMGPFEFFFFTSSWNDINPILDTPGDTVDACHDQRSAVIPWMRACHFLECTQAFWRQ